MHILVTNDDGVTAPGLLALAQALRPLGRVTVLAPDRNWSASGHQKTLHRPLRVRPAHLSDGSPALACDGAPSDCVALMALGLLDEPVDLVVSGINPYGNLGQDLTYSGTVTAAIEGTIWGYPSLAVSLNAKDHVPEFEEYLPAAGAALQVARQMLQHKLPPATLLNLNVPCLPAEQILGMHITRQGSRIYRDELVRREDPMGRPYYWIGGEPPTGVPEPGTDIGELERGYISLTPLQLDLTAYAAMAHLQGWTWENT